MRTFILLGALLFSGCTQDTKPASSPAPAPAAAAAVTLPAGMSRVTDRSHVCMVNDFAMGRPQIPVEVNGRTYFGCCPDCKLKLETREANRIASDPVTGEPVDKASAVIVRDESGKVYYFASEDTLRRFRG
ncbi:MAG: hypothetical protein JNL83_34695 [Myxococcales bacterium]|nr:hypothetical protein [Myxococcales bacterium]